MPSFDVVSEVDMHELQNALDQTNREIANRYDFKGSGAHVECDGETLTLSAQSRFQIEQMMDILMQKLAKRGIDLECLDRGRIEESNNKASQPVTVCQGIDTETGKRITKLIKDSKLKVQAAVQGEKVRLTGKKRDDLQQAMGILRGASLGIPLQYENFRD